MTLFEKLESSQIVTEPFPHLVVENVLDEPLYTSLRDQFPPLNSFTEGKHYRSSHKLHRSAATLLPDPSVSDDWKTFLRTHLTAETWHQMINLFGPHIRDEYPDFEQQFGKLSDLRIGTRYRDDYAHCDVLLDAQLNVHTPVSGAPAWDRGPHVKSRNKVLVSHFFMRPEEDRSEGADLELYSIRPGVEPTYGEFQVTDHRHLKVERVIPYRGNTLIFFLNSPRSIQGWSVRTPSPLPFMYFHVIAQMSENLFTLPATTTTRPRQRWRKLARRALDFSVRGRV